jgi:hypothetical protein
MKSFFLILIAHIVGVILLYFVGVYLNDITSSFSGKNGGVVSVFSVAWGIYVPFVTILYNKNRKFHFWANRLLMLFSKSHTYWKPSYRFTFADADNSESQKAIDKTIEALKEIFKVRVLSKDLLNARIQVDEKYVLILSNDGKSLHLTFDRKELVPSHLYEAFTKHLGSLGEALQAALQPLSETSFAVMMNFDDGAKNPYYGFFINEIPSDLLNSFEVSFRLNQRSQCRIEAGKDFISVDGRSLLDVCEALNQVSTLRAIPLGA